MDTQVIPVRPSRPVIPELHPSTTTCPPTPKPTPHPELHARASLDSVRHDSNDCAPTQSLPVTLRLTDCPQAASGYVRHGGQNSTNLPGAPATAWVKTLASRSAANHERDATEARRTLAGAYPPRTRACVSTSPRRRRPASSSSEARNRTVVVDRSGLGSSSCTACHGVLRKQCLKPRSTTRMRRGS